MTKKSISLALVALFYEANIGSVPAIVDAFVNDMKSTLLELEKQLWENYDFPAFEEGIRKKMCAFETAMLEIMLNRILMGCNPIV